MEADAVTGVRSVSRVANARLWGPQLAHLERPLQFTRQALLSDISAARGVVLKLKLDQHASQLSTDISNMAVQLEEVYFEIGRALQAHEIPALESAIRLAAKQLSSLQPVYAKAEAFAKTINKKR